MNAIQLTPDFTFEQDALLALGEALKQHGYRFITPTPSTLERVGRRPVNRYADTAEQVFGWNRPFHRNPLPAPLAAAALRAGVFVPAPAESEQRAAVRFSTLGEDLYVHSSFPTNTPDAVFFGPDSYRFANAIDAALRVRTSTVATALDIGCGAGPGALRIARACPNAEVIAADINHAALACCAINARLAGLENIHMRHSDLFGSLPLKFDLIVSNPPYLLDPQARLYRHGGGTHGEALSVRIVEHSLGRLAPGGCLLLYTGTAITDNEDPLLRAVAPVLRACGKRWEYRELDPDVFGEELDKPAYDSADRIAVVLLTVWDE